MVRYITAAQLYEYFKTKDRPQSSPIAVALIIDAVLAVAIAVIWAAVR
jgi:hypothetical protein